MNRPCASHARMSSPPGPRTPESSRFPGARARLRYMSRREAPFSRGDPPRGIDLGFCTPTVVADPRQKSRVRARSSLDTKCRNDHRLPLSKGAEKTPAPSNPHGPRRGTQATRQRIARAAPFRLTPRLPRRLRNVHPSGNTVIAAKRDQRLERGSSSGRPSKSSMQNRPRIGFCEGAQFVLQNSARLPTSSGA